MFWLWVIGSIIALLLFALLIDLKRKKNNNLYQRGINPHSKEGESSNYVMGQDQDHSGGG
ncbi:hypothetical protein [Chengkuizengella axinellae]|uniref:Uncharacterized protein n=1 Tax=Chengkuizengella axinellae TaxID=3064388 RepID=A0ABT9J2T6_9BACL|nr:hypothetical protein [Chengkuizengella sp. 2205SS18-9]MDP5275911.1 hypothetical protein [Chengkuizengella sp. 2205SS18-9]